MYLIADSGSTKTDWAIVTGKAAPVVIHTQGINPIHQSREEIVSILSGEFQSRMSENADVRRLKSSGVLTHEFPMAVFFYGSGVRPEKESLMVQLLHEVFPQALTVEAHSDLLGAARALCGHREGIACILGTGANSCLYDGTQILQHTPALGYILGDEGGGAALGKRFLHDLYGGRLPQELLAQFEKELKLSLPRVIDRVYRQPLANRWLASLSEFIGAHVADCEPLARLVEDNFADFLDYHVSPYRHADLPVSFIGSVAWNYQDQLHAACGRLGYHVGTVLRTPLGGLVGYHRF